MSRKMLLRLACGASVFFAGIATQVSWSDDDDAFESPRAISMPAAELGAPPVPNAAELRQRLLELMAKRTQRMTPEELTRSIDELTKTLAEQDSAADAELKKATEQLKAVVEKYPGTPAAASARRALQAMPAPTDVGPRSGSKPFGPDEEEEFDAARTIPRPATIAPVRPVSKKPR